MDRILASIERIAAETQAAEARVIVRSVGLSPTLLAALDAWIADQAEPKPAHPEAIRRLLCDRLAELGYAPDGLPPGEAGPAA